jgi:hypothetical protein
MSILDSVADVDKPAQQAAQVQRPVGRPLAPLVDFLLHREYDARDFCARIPQGRSSRHRMHCLHIFMLLKRNQ